jgi:hypothetical protein
LPRKVGSTVFLTLQAFLKKGKKSNKYSVCLWLYLMVLMKGELSRLSFSGLASLVAPGDVYTIAWHCPGSTLMFLAAWKHPGFMPAGGSLLVFWPWFLKPVPFRRDALCRRGVIKKPK